MTLTEIIPSLQLLSRQEKLKVIQFLADLLAKEDENLPTLENGKHYEVWSPYDAFLAEHILTQMLQDDSPKPEI
ncbi:MAG TPA: hypothetical protein VK184_11305 [Nostocaceae cyanobacterium]|nr:hypothetical protein [Nostocaceae cyanobacterium]